ncbi:single-stranded DNA-binding protein [Actinophytocola sediminis]
MANEPVVTIVGNLTADPELRFTGSGHAVANLTVAETPRQFVQGAGWKDGDPLFMRCTIWRDMAENVAESLRRGMSVIVQGRLKQRTFETREGQKRSVIELEVDAIGPNLRWQVATVAKAGRGSAPTRVVAPSTTEDPWGTPEAERELVGASAGGGDKPPF